MKTRLILKPGQRGTKRLTDKYGDDLVCVRFRYDAISKQRLKTVELVIERIDWEPRPEKFSADTLVAVKVEGYETDLRRLIKEAGGKWNPEQKLWYVRFGNIKGSPLEKHLYIDTLDK